MRKPFHQKLTRNKHTLIRACGNDNREVVGLAQTSVKDNVVVHIVGVVVADDADETDLMVDDE